MLAWTNPLLFSARKNRNRRGCSGNLQHNDLYFVRQLASEV